MAVTVEGQKREKSLSASHQASRVGAGLAVGAGEAVVEEDAPRNGWIGCVGIRRPVPTGCRARKVRLVDGGAVGAVVDDGQQLAPRGQAPAGVVAAARRGVVASIGIGGCRGRVPGGGLRLQRPDQAGDVVARAGPVGGGGSADGARGVGDQSAGALGMALGMAVPAEAGEVKARCAAAGLGRQRPGGLGGIAAEAPVLAGVRGSVAGAASIAGSGPGARVVHALHLACVVERSCLRCGPGGQQGQGEGGEQVTQAQAVLIFRHCRVGGCDLIHGMNDASWKNLID